MEPLDTARHGDALYRQLILSGTPELWTYLPANPPQDRAEFDGLLHRRQTEPNTRAYAIVDSTTGQPSGTTSFLRIDPPNGVLEVGWVLFAPALQRTTAATEALFLQIDHAFRLGYRRVEWKCDSLNQPSRAAATRLGFHHEGIFRQAVVTKGRNRDTAWYSLIDAEWPARRDPIIRWLAPSNFHPDGRQIRQLSRETPPPSSG